VATELFNTNVCCAVVLKNRHCCALALLFYPSGSRRCPIYFRTGLVHTFLFLLLLLLLLSLIPSSFIAAVFRLAGYYAVCTCLLTSKIPHTYCNPHACCVWVSCASWFSWLCFRLVYSALHSFFSPWVVNSGLQAYCWATCRRARFFTEVYVSMMTAPFFFIKDSFASKISHESNIYEIKKEINRLKLV